MTAALLVALGYFIGSVPFAFLIARWAGGLDIRAVGSGNVGAANVLRTAGKRAAAWTALFDVAKGAGAVAAVWSAGGSSPTVAAAGVAAIAGHIYPVWLRFRGGKGVATSFGVFVTLAPAAALLSLAIFVAAIRLTRYVSVASMAAAISLGPLVYAASSSVGLARAAFVSGCLVLFKHRQNLARLIDGTEPRVGERAFKGTAS
jgi:acyl phosphate:glycerol-3-phosphate acyltransferase